jgi:succinoglycan biosynthesis protein ExoA
MPSISIIVPCYNEQATVCKLLDALLEQSYPRGDLEVVIADGMSTDRTREEIAAFADSHPELHIAVVDNPKRNTPSGLNNALREAQGEIIIRLDAHSMPATDYIEHCVADLEMGLGENVGGIWEIHPSEDTWAAKSIAAAAAHPIAVGDALYRHTARAGAVDTVPFGAFKRELLALIGFYDETLLSNEDYEFNARIRKAGGKVWLDPSIRSVYFARPNFAALAKQYFRYGFWKWRMLRRYPETLRWRQALPPLFVLGLAGLVILGIFVPLIRAVAGAVIILYILTLSAAGINAALHTRQNYLIYGLPLAIATMHICWGSGFLWSMIKGLVSRKELEKK